MLARKQRRCLNTSRPTHWTQPRSQILLNDTPTRRSSSRLPRVCRRTHRLHILPIRFSNAPRRSITRASSLISDYVQHSIESSALPGTRGVGSSRHAAQILIYSSVGSTTDASTLHHLLPGFLKRACVFRRATLASPGFKSGSDVVCVLTRTCACERVGREKERERQGGSAGLDSAAALGEAAMSHPATIPTSDYFVRKPLGGNVTKRAHSHQISAIELAAQRRRSASRYRKIMLAAAPARTHASPTSGPCRARRLGCALNVSSLLRNSHLFSFPRGEHA